jgi:hypothetical protein
MKKNIVACVMLALSSAVMIHAQDRTVNLNGEPVVVTTGAAGRGFVVNTGPAQRGIALPLEARIVKGQPYSAEVVSESVQTLADGNRIVQKTTGRVYRDSEGRMRRPGVRRSDHFHHGLGSRHGLHTRSREPHGAANAGPGRRAHTACRPTQRSENRRGDSRASRGRCTRQRAVGSAASAASTATSAATAGTRRSWRPRWPWWRFAIGRNPGGSAARRRARLGCPENHHHREGRPRQ